MLLTAEDLLPKRVLDQITRLPARSFLPTLYDVIAGRCTELAAHTDSTRADEAEPAAFDRARSVHDAEDRAALSRACIRARQRGRMAGRTHFCSRCRGRPRLAVTRARDSRGSRRSGPEGVRARDDFRQPPGPTPSSRRVAPARPTFATVSPVSFSAGHRKRKVNAARCKYELSKRPALEALVHAAAAKKDQWPDYAVRLGVDTEQ